MMPSSSFCCRAVSLRLENSKHHLSHSSHRTRTPVLRACCSLGEYVLERVRSTCMYHRAEVTALRYDLHDSAAQKTTSVLSASPHAIGR